VRDIFDFVGEDCPIAIGEDAVMPAALVEPGSRPAARPSPQPAAPQPRARPRGGAPRARARCRRPRGRPRPPPRRAGRHPGAPPRRARAGQSIRIDLIKLDKLIDTVGELVIAQAMLVQRLQNENVQSSEELTLLESLTRDIQESAMSIRAQPIGSVFSRVPRILRELAASTGKHVNLQVFGETTELDKTVIERLGEPLTHLIRNAVDHGIEKPEDRLAGQERGRHADPVGRAPFGPHPDPHRRRWRGHQPRARVCQGGGKGPDLADAQLSKEEIDNLIFAPGFSTAATITNVSGRGVGMDVVRQNVKDLGGRITIERRGQGHHLHAHPAADAGHFRRHDREGGRPDAGGAADACGGKPAPRTHVQGLGANRQMLNVRGRFIPVVSVGMRWGRRALSPARRKAC
jgi:two-component system chemotaxis sensor kinase CheA